MEPLAATMPQTPWQLDKKVPIALILAILLQTAAGVWYAAKQDARVEMLEVQTKNLLKNDAKTADAIGSVREGMSAYKTTLEHMRASLDRIERGIDNQRGIDVRRN